MNVALHELYVKIKRRNITGHMLSRILRPFALFLALALVFNLAKVSPAQSQGVAEYFQISYSITGLSQTQVTGSQSFTVRVTGQAVAKKDLPIPASEAVITGKIVAQNTSNGTEVTLNPSYVVNINPFPSKTGDTFNIDQPVSLQFPAGSSAGSYNIVGKLVKAEVKALIWIDVTSFLPGTLNAGAVTYNVSADIIPPVVTVGGGGSVSIPVQATPAPAFSITLMGKPQEWQAKDDGSMKQDTRISSPDGKITLFLKEGTRVLDKNSIKLPSISVNEEKSPNPATGGNSIIGTAYNLGPSGSQLQPYLELTLSYVKPLASDISEKDLKIAYWDENGGKWLPLESQVDMQANTVTTKVTHFSTFAIIGRIFQPANFSISSLDITPRSVKTGERVTISAEVSNTGELGGDYNLQLIINGALTQSKAISLTANTRQKINFEISSEQPGTRSVNVGGLTGNFTVIAPPLFAISDLAVSTMEAKPGEKVDISATVSNNGGSQGIQKLDLIVNGSVLQSREVTLPAGSSEMVSFSVAMNNSGSYSINLGELSGSFSVATPPPPPPAFSLSSLSMSHTEARPGETVTISTDVSNNGGSQGTHRLDLAINGSVLKSKEVTLAAGSAEKVSFSVAMDNPGSYNVSLGELSGSFSILAPASFTLASLSITPTEASPGAKVTISTDVGNDGGSQGTYRLDLAINGTVLQSREVTLEAGSSESISFSVAMDAPGSYNVSLGELSGAFKIKKSSLSSSPWFLIAVMAFAIAAVYLILRRYLLRTTA